nr:immunoglobulin light chain junction region [Macaca mulatta]
CQHYKTYPYSF